MLNSCDPPSKSTWSDSQYAANISHPMTHVGAFAAWETESRVNATAIKCCCKQSDINIMSTKTLDSPKDRVSRIPRAISPKIKIEKKH